MSCAPELPVILEQPSNDDCWLQRGQNAEECAACVGGRAGNRRAVWGYSILWNSLILGKWEPDLRSHRHIPFNKQPNDCGCEHLSFQRSVWGAFYALLKDSELLSTNLTMFFFFLLCIVPVLFVSVGEKSVSWGDESGMWMERWIFSLCCHVKYDTAVPVRKLANRFDRTVTKEACFFTDRLSFLKSWLKKKKRKPGVSFRVTMQREMINLLKPLKETILGSGAAVTSIIESGSLDGWEGREKKNKTCL